MNSLKKMMLISISTLVLLILCMTVSPKSSQAAIRGFMGTWDLDGDGSNELAYNLGQRLEIQNQEASALHT
ncbi:hypothetical protein ABE060_14210 [Bacillus rugosus]|uniref:hypothetical protein n=1 Tax=Bacillus rugosus TaxID=2715209 RepID=UPI001FE2A44B|nr:hypothetical protein [Bacillus rugosus]